jgi:hypothetical protein
MRYPRTSEQEALEYARMDSEDIELAQGLLDATLDGPMMRGKETTFKPKLGAKEAFAKLVKGRTKAPSLKQLDAFINDWLPELRAEIDQVLESTSETSPSPPRAVLFAGPRGPRCGGKNRTTRL